MAEEMILVGNDGEDGQRLQTFDDARTHRRIGGHLGVHLIVGYCRSCDGGVSAPSVRVAFRGVALLQHIVDEDICSGGYGCDAFCVGGGSSSQYGGCAHTEWLRVGCALRGWFAAIEGVAYGGSLWQCRQPLGIGYQQCEGLFAEPMLLAELQLLCSGTQREEE